MLFDLPPINENKTLDYDHFPTKMQCFIYRNWGVVSPEKLAEVLGTNKKNVIDLAVDMGLCSSPKISKEWFIKGYITIIRANWHLLDYEQLCLLLDWDIEKLAYILREDDFLSVKLGNFKSNTPKLIYRELSEDEKKQTKFIKEVTLKAISLISPEEIEPFDFKTMFKRLKSDEITTVENAYFRRRIVYSYCALYGDTFISEENLLESFPDELLKSYQALGINGIWTQAVLYTLVPFKFDLNYSDGYELRMKGLNSLINRLNKYGIKLYLYINEPRAMSESFFEKYPQFRGETNDSYSTLCLSCSEVSDYIKDSANYIVKNAPDLGGFITISASENLTNCYSHRNKSNIQCPRCKKREPSDLYSDINRLLYEGASSVNPDIDVVAWTWGWPGIDCIKDTIDKLPAEVSIMGVSEQAVKKDIGGTETSVIDYSISVVGPGEYALSTWEHAHKKGHKTFAKVQVNNTWECSCVPCIPCFEQIYKHISTLINSGEVDNIMLGWTLGGYPSSTMKMLNLMYKNKDISLDEIYEEIFPKNLIPQLKKIFHLFSVSFDNFPFHISTAYTAPQNYGPSNLLYKNKTGFTATMVGYPYDDLNTWRSIFPVETFVNQLKKLSEGWKEGMDAFNNVSKDDIKANSSISELYDCAEALYCHFRSMYLQSVFVLKRDANENTDDITEEEKSLCIRLANVMSRNPTIGYESSNHYFYTRAALLEKYLCCEYIKNK